MGNVVSDWQEYPIYLPCFAGQKKLRIRPRSVVAKMPWNCIEEATEAVGRVNMYPLGVISAGHLLCTNMRIRPVAPGGSAEVSGSAGATVDVMFLEQGGFPWNTVLDAFGYRLPTEAYDYCDFAEAFQGTDLCKLS